jgi:hypothetical protein
VQPEFEAATGRNNLATLHEDLSAEPHQELHGLHIAGLELAVVLLDPRIINVLDGVTERLQSMALIHGGPTAKCLAG